MMGFFDTLEEAQADLERRRKEAYERIEKEGDTILQDTSFIGHPFNIDNSEKWAPYLMIWTQSMLDDIKNMKGFDYEEFERREKEIHDNDEVTKQMKNGQWHNWHGNG